MSIPSTAGRSLPCLRRWSAGLILALAVSGCASDFGAQTMQPYQPAVGISDRSGHVYAINTLVVTDGHDNGTVVSSLINEQTHPDKLESVSATNDKGSTLQVLPMPAGGVALPVGKAVPIGKTGVVRLSGKRLIPGYFVSLTFTFQRAAPVQMKVPVVSRSSMYRQVPVGPTTVMTPLTPAPTRPTTPAQPSRSHKPGRPSHPAKSHATTP